MTWVGKTIRELRNEAGMSVSELSDMSDIAASTLTNIELGISAGNIRLVERILEVFGYELEIVPGDGIGPAKRG